MIDSEKENREVSYYNNENNDIIQPAVSRKGVRDENYDDGGGGTDMMDKTGKNFMIRKTN